MPGGKARLPPRWFVVAAWHVHRLIVRASRRRKGLWPPRPGKWGALRLTTRGRRSGSRLWQRWREWDKNLDDFAARRPRETAVVVLEPRAATG